MGLPYALECRSTGVVIPGYHIGLEPHSGIPVNSGRVQLGCNVFGDHHQWLDPDLLPAARHQESLRNTWIVEFKARKEENRRWIWPRTSEENISMSIGNFLHMFKILMETKHVRST